MDHMPAAFPKRDMKNAVYQPYCCFIMQLRVLGWIFHEHVSSFSSSTNNAVKQRHRKRK